MSWLKLLAKAAASPLTPYTHSPATDYGKK